MMKMLNSFFVVFMILNAALAENTNQVNTIRNEITEQFKNHFEEYAKEMQKIKEEIQRLSEKNSLLENEVNSLKISRISTNFIGFFAYHGDHATYGAGATIMFPYDMTNIGPEGSLYDPITSKFHCDVPGMYFFTFALLSTGDIGIWAAIDVGGTQYASGHVVPIHSGGYTCANSAVVHCDHEDVYVKATAYSYVHGSSYSSFTGYLLSMD